MPVGLSLQHVSKSFGERKAVDDLSFSMEHPGVFGLIGTNGAGKTTTIRMTLGVMDRDAGEITWNGGPLAASRATRSPSATCRRSAASIRR